MKTLVVAPAWVGDMVMAQSLVAVLRRDDPTNEVHMLAPAATAPLAERMSGVTRVRPLPVGHGELAFAVRRAAAAELRAERFDRAIVLPNTFKSALVPWLARIPLRTGWRGEWRYGLLNDLRVLDESRLLRLVDRYVALGPLRRAPIPVTPAPRLDPQPDRLPGLLARLELAEPSRVLALCPGAEYGAAKRWPQRHFAAVASAHLRSGGTVWLLGSTRDAEHTRAVASALGECRSGRLFDLAGRTSLLDAIELLSCVDAVVTNDSGLMHVAGALGRRVIAVYGSTSPEFTPPLGAKATIVYQPPPCSPCFERVCPLGHTRCLEELDPAHVIRVLEPA
jgi:heptosyltransferase-2